MGLVAAAVVVTAIRRPALARASLVAWVIGSVLIALAAAGPIWNRPAAQTVAVMVDLSPSTRTAAYRDREILDRRIHELLRNAPYRIQFFADGIGEVDPTATHLPDLPASQTAYIPPPGAAVLLFSDCQFALPKTSPPTYVVVDTGLEDPADAAVTDIEIRSDSVAASARNTGGPRNLVISGTANPGPTPLPAGTIVVSKPLPAGASHISAEISPGDPWPENDSLSTVVPPPLKYERWWVGHSNPGPDWRAMLPAELPTDPAAYLYPALIVIENTPASELSETQQQRLSQYVRDLAGGLILLGGDRAFAAGGYAGTSLESLSPLASYPPLPTTHWILVADSSGSMATPIEGSTRWKFVTDAMAKILPNLPPQDLVSIGSFAESLQWWVQGKSVQDAMAISLPPADANPHGPTNLQPAIQAIARSVDGHMPVNLLILSDFDAQMTDPDALASLLESKNVHLHLIAIGEGAALPALRQIAGKTGGSVITEIDPTLWAKSAVAMARRTAPKLVERDPVYVVFAPAAQAGPQRTTSAWNRAWFKDSVTRIGHAIWNAQEIPMAARWEVGEGRVLAAAFDAPPGLVDRLSDLVASPPRDPRFAVTWESARDLVVRINAVDDGKYLNNQSLTMELGELSTVESAARRPIAQIGPGQYRLTMPAPRSARIATVRAGGKIIARRAIAGRYAPEFEAIGNDHAAMRELARRSGGEVIAPTQTAAIDIHWPPRPVSLTSILATSGAALIALGLIWQRIS